MRQGPAERTPRQAGPRPPPMRRDRPRREARAHLVPAPAGNGAAAPERRGGRPAVHAPSTRVRRQRGQLRDRLQIRKPADDWTDIAAWTAPKEHPIWDHLAGKRRAGLGQRGEGNALLVRRSADEKRRVRDKRTQRTIRLDHGGCRHRIGVLWRRARRLDRDPPSEFSGLLGQSRSKVAWSASQTCAPQTGFGDRRRITQLARDLLAHRRRRRGVAGLVRRIRGLPPGSRRDAGHVLQRQGRTTQTVLGTTHIMEYCPYILPAYLKQPKSIMA